MEFDVIDPKDHSFDEWIDKVEGFLTKHYPQYIKREGDLYFTRDDIAEPWGEESILYLVEGEEGGMIELRESDQKTYLFAEEFAGRNLKDSKDINHFQLKAPTTVYGFNHQSLSKSRFHKGPISKVYFLYQGEISDHPLSTSLERLWEGTLFQAIHWIHNQVGRFQTLKKIFESEGVMNHFEMDVTFTHPASLNLILEKVSRASIRTRERKRIQLYIENPPFDQLRDLFEAMPPDDLHYESLELKMVWGVELPSHEREIITYIGAEKRQLKPFVHLPRQRCARSFREQFRDHFKGYRVDRQEYLLD